MIRAIPRSVETGPLEQDRKGGTDMTAIRASYRSLSQLADLNWDRLLYAATIVVALVAGSFFGHLFL
ncbi:hypothetical protein CEW89_03855 [Celeribacter ethanolicus]|uniref:Uncharacterized protein n=1 Tax=Celeribacter ethanolicus TaxID=1758178 RepID=A0A291G9F5_9RHOB|nr:hypothetical protein CEW89_03855 [Celeribacter ethanolicus]